MRATCPGRFIPSNLFAHLKGIMTWRVDIMKRLIILCILHPPITSCLLGTGILRTFLLFTLNYLQLLFIPPRF